MPNKYDNCHGNLKNIHLEISIGISNIYAVKIYIIKDLSWQNVGFEMEKALKIRGNVAEGNQSKKKVRKKRKYYSHFFT